jgi:hypothetical protein
MLQKFRCTFLSVKRWQVFNENWCKYAKLNINSKKETPAEFCMNLAGVLCFCENM